MMVFGPTCLQARQVITAPYRVRVGVCLGVGGGGGKERRVLVTVLLVNKKGLQKRTRTRRTA
jgi:hypothetical protein